MLGTFLDHILYSLNNNNLEKFEFMIVINILDINWNLI